MEKVINKKVVSRFLFCVIMTAFVLCNPVSAANNNIEVEHLSDGGYFITEIIENDSPEETRATGSKTGSKIGWYYDEQGNACWYVRVTASFSYNGSTSICSGVAVSADEVSSGWEITAKTTSRTGNSGTASATARRSSDGKTFTKTVTLTCDKNGNLS